MYILCSVVLGVRRIVDAVPTRNASRLLVVSDGRVLGLYCGRGGSLDFLNSVGSKQERVVDWRCSWSVYVCM